MQLLFSGMSILYPLTKLKPCEHNDIRKMSSQLGNLDAALKDLLLQVTAASLSYLPETINSILARASVQTGGAVTFINVDFTVIA